MNSHLISVPGVGTLSTWTLPGCDSQSFSWDSDWSLHFEFMILGGIDNLTTGSFQRLDIQSSDSESINTE